MDAREFGILSEEVRKLAKQAPRLGWGKVQNDKTDSKLDLFGIRSYTDLEKSIAQMADDDKNYWRRRWFVWQCSRCDEYLFYRIRGVERNPNRKDKSWDIRINGTIEFDIKGTRIPTKMRKDAERLINDPKDLIHFYYEKQSTGVRYDIQNRLFIVHHSFVGAEREVYLRTAWKSKPKIYEEYVANINRIRLYEYNGVQTSVIFIFEREKGKVDYHICGL